MSKVLVDRDWLKRTHRDLDACQKLIWANIRGADPAYCSDAQDRLKEIDEMLAQPADAEGVEVRGLQWLDTGHYRKKPPQFGYNPHDWNPLMTVAQHQRILSAVTAERDRLRDALEHCVDSLGSEYALPQECVKQARAAMAAKEA